MLNVWRIRHGTIHGTIHGVNGVAGYGIQRASVRKEVVRAIGREHLDCFDFEDSEIDVVELTRSGVSVRKAL
jgi:hypothetical protein